MTIPRRRTPGEVASYVDGYKAGVRMLEGKLDIHFKGEMPIQAELALEETHAVITTVIETAIDENKGV